MEEDRSMRHTSLSLLARLQQSPNSGSWDRLVALYEPLLRRWLARYDVQAHDADDLVQEVLLAVSRDLGAFEHNGRPGAFRAWLRVTLVHRVRNFWRARGRHEVADGGSQMDSRLTELEDPATALTQLWNREHDRHVLRRLLSSIEPGFSPSTWLAFRRLALEGARPQAVAQELAMSVNAVFIAKSRVLSRLRQEAEGLVEASSEFPAPS